MTYSKKGYVCIINTGGETLISAIHSMKSIVVMIHNHKYRGNPTFPICWRLVSNQEHAKTAIEKNWIKTLNKYEIVKLFIEITEKFAIAKTISYIEEENPESDSE